MLMPLFILCTNIANDDDDGDDAIKSYHDNQQFPLDLLFFFLSFSVLTK